MALDENDERFGRCGGRVFSGEGICQADGSSMVAGERLSLRVFKESGKCRDGGTRIALGEKQTGVDKRRTGLLGRADRSGRREGSPGVFWVTLIE